MPSKRKRGNAYELRASCGFNAKGKRIMKTRTWKPPYGMTEAQAEKEATRQAFLELLVGYQILEIARTGLTGLRRGNKRNQ